MKYASYADMVLVNGNVLCLDDNNTCAEAIAVKDGKILTVGSSQEILELKNDQTEVVDLSGSTVIPGFIDAHTHVDLIGMMSSDKVVSCWLPPLESKDQILKAFEERANAVPDGELIVGQGRWSQEYPKKEELDKVAPNNPIILRTTMHFYILNNCALKRFGITKDRPTPKELFQVDPGSIIFRDKITGEPTGQLYDAWNFLFPQSKSFLSYGQTRSAIKKGLDKFSSFGVTTIAEFPDFYESIRIYNDLRASGELNMRLHLVPCVHGLHRTTSLESVLELGLRTGFGDEWIKFGGIKLFVDRGVDTSLSSIELKEIVAAAQNAGIRVFMHANTRKGQDMAIEAIEAAVQEFPEFDLRGQDLRGQFDVEKSSDNTPHLIELRHRIEHMGNRLIDYAFFDRVKNAGAIALPTSYFMNIGRHFPKDMKVFMYKTMLEKGLCVPGNSDSGAAEPEAPNPLYEIWCMVARKSRAGDDVFPEEGISILEALKVYTRHSAYACLEEDIKGSIERGKLADLAVLNKNPLETATDDLPDIKTEMTLIGGRIVYTA